MTQMKLNVEPGRYVVAVSGGVDSMALLDMLAGLPGLRLTVAHYDHGIRPESAEDRKLVQNTAAKYGLPFVYDEGKLGASASEATARAARYRFLRSVKASVGAKAIITAHHQDDLLETAILNLLRGTGRKGLSSLSETAEIKRPLLSYRKDEIIEYARQHRLSWHEDRTNRDQKYLRNRIRHTIMPHFDAESRRAMLEIIGRMQSINGEIDTLLMTLFGKELALDRLDRRQFINLPHEVSKELLAAWLRQRGLADFDRKLLERVTIMAKVMQPGKRIDLLHGNMLVVHDDTLALND